MKEKMIKIFSLGEEAILLLIVFFLPIYFAFAQENYNVFELNKLVFFRTFLMIALLLHVARVFLPEAVGVSPWNFTKNENVFRLNKKIFVLLVLLGLTFFISSYFSINPSLSFWGSYGRQQGFYSFFNYFLFFILLVLNLQETDQPPAGRIRPLIKKIIFAMMFSSVFVCLYGLLQYFAIDPLDWKEKILDIGRIFSTFGQPNFLGQYLILVIPLSIFSFIFLHGRWFSRFLAAILILAQMACLLFTYSRAAWLGLFAFFFLLAISFLFIKKKQKMAWSLIGLGLAGIIIIISFNIFYFKKDVLWKPGEINFSNRLESMFDLRGGSNRIRLYYWQAAWKEFKQAGWERKLIGYGPETLADIFVKYYQPDWGVHEKINTFPDRSHNAFFDIILQFGLAGLAAFMIFLGYIFSAVFKYLKTFPLTEEYWLAIFILAVLAGYFMNSLFGFSLTVAYVYFYAFLAILAAISFPKIFPPRSSDRAAKEFFHPFSRILIWVVIFFVSGVFIYYYNINALRADYYYMKAKKAEAKNDCVGILDNMEKAVAWNPVSVFYKENYIFHSLNCFEGVESKESQLNLRDNMISMINFIGAREYSFYTWVNVARAYSILGYYINPGYYAEAEENFSRLIKINPYITFTYQSLGRVKLWQKDYEGAIANFQKAIDSMPPLDNSSLNNEHKQEIEIELVRLFEMTGLTYSYKRDWGEALNYYRRALRFDPHYLRLYKEIADIYYQQGDLGEAIFYNQRGYMLNPADSAWPLAISLLYKELGDKANEKYYSEIVASLGEGK